MNRPIPSQHVAIIRHSNAADEVHPAGLVDASAVFP